MILTKLPISILSLLVLLLLTACGPAVKSQRSTRFTSIAIINQLTLYFDSDLTQQERLECQQAADYHNQAFRSQVFPVVQSAIAGNTGNIVILPSPAPKIIYIYKAHHLNAPYRNEVNGWVDLDLNTRPIHIVAGLGNTLPDLTFLLTEAYYPNTPAYTVNFSGLPNPMPFWDYVRFVNDGIMRFLKFVRGIP